MKIRAIGSMKEVLHFSKLLERSNDYVYGEEPSDIFPITDGADAGKFRRHYKVREVFRPTTSKKK